MIVGVLGAGAMGSGIAQVAATAGHSVLLRDINEAAAQKGIESVRKSLGGQVAKQKLTQERADEILGRIGNGSAEAASLSECGLVIEAIVEDLDVKQRTFREIETTVSPECILATNTSSLSVTAIADACARPERVIGIHFFNPAAVLPLVEIVPGKLTSPEITKRSRALIDSWGKTTVIASDTPGFIVNRIARPFYGEAIRIYEEGMADSATIDWAMKEIGGFRMGPFELMDFIGNDINLAATTAVYEGTNRDPRYKPSLTQQRLVEAGKLGMKSGRGHYDYSDGAEKPEPTKNEALGKRIADRIIAMLVNEAADAAVLGIGTPADIDLAMTKGVNYPKGLLQWGNEIGLDNVANAIETLRAESGGDERYRVSPLLKEMAAHGKSFHQ
ncbi:MAG: 3-hydroxyacyl-CoA dehydrogenase NAD-binding domain-containing protein [Gemmatimonadota bacterium]|nr:3-hydroxyacyl-CoA dehydrogenase NAD-binding domain-containing protein [Gemmatimonadota bacterium]